MIPVLFVVALYLFSDPVTGINTSNSVLFVDYGFQGSATANINQQNWDYIPILPFTVGDTGDPVTIEHTDSTYGLTVTTSGNCNSNSVLILSIFRRSRMTNIIFGIL